MYEDIVAKAEKVAVAAHAGQTYGSNGREYIYHPCQVAELAARLGYDKRVVAAAYLHDVLEDTSYPEATLRTEFGDLIADAVVAVSYFEIDKQHDVDKVGKALANTIGHVVKFCDSSCNLANVILYGPGPGHTPEEAYNRYMGYLDRLRKDLPTPKDIARFL